MAMAVLKLHPGTKVATGPVTDTGFYYDFDSLTTFTPDDLTKITKEMERIIKANLPIIREVVDRDEIQTEIVGIEEPFKLEILNSIPEGEEITRYFIGNPDVGRGQLIEGSLIIPITHPPDNYKKIGLRVEVDQSGERLGKLIRNAELEKIPVLTIVGKKELESKTMTIRTKLAGDLGMLTLDEIITKLQEAIALKSFI
jgi:threonyl-tRNA synthetase